MSDRIDRLEARAQALSAQTADKVGLSPCSVPNYRRAALADLTIPEGYINED